MGKSWKSSARAVHKQVRDAWSSANKKWTAAKNSELADYLRSRQSLTDYGRQLNAQYNKGRKRARARAAVVESAKKRRRVTAPLRKGRRAVGATVGKRFSRKFSSATSKFAKYGYICKREAGGVVSHSQSVYIGHNCTALADTWRAITYAVGRWFARKVGQDFNDINQFVSGMATSDPNAVWRITYKTAPDGNVVASSFATSGAIIWGLFMDALYNLIQGAIGTNDYFELLTIELYSPDNVASTRDIPYTTIDARQFRVSVKGSSSMVIQNTTLASIADPDGDVRDNISANPLHGKRYIGRGQYFGTWLQANTAGGTKNVGLATRANDGLVVWESDPYAGNNMGNGTRDQIRKPPPYYAFSGMTASANAMIKPGEIRRSYMSKTYTYDVNKWIQICIPYLKNSPEGNRLNMKFLGSAIVFGFERLLDSRSDEPDVRLSYEVNLSTQAVAYYKPSLKFVPQLFID